MVIVLLKYSHSSVFLEQGLSQCFHAKHKIALPVHDNSDETREVQGPQETREIIEIIVSICYNEGPVRDDTFRHNSYWGKEPFPDGKHQDKNHSGRACNCCI